ncbi:MAG TPA: hypothetical protein VHT75_07775 [Acidimicrobiales bacterium]|jgi:hypothetical protein|nr:hypothetical protein [Acidimicrobiales bacterium]
MRTPTSFAKTGYDAQASTVPDGSATHDGDGRLVEIDTILAKMAKDDHLAAEEPSSEVDAQEGDGGSTGLRLRIVIPTFGSTPTWKHAAPSAAEATCGVAAAAGAGGSAPGSSQR